MRVLDLFCGLGGFSQAFRERGHEVLGVDIAPPADVVHDVRRFTAGPGSFDVVLAAPPCTEFSRESMPWCRTGKAPSTELVEHALRVIRTVKPQVGWLLENVRGSQKYIDPLAPRHSKVGFRYLWGEFPSFAAPPEVRKQHYEGNVDCERKRLRSKVAHSTSLAVCLAAENALQPAVERKAA